VIRIVRSGYRNLDHVNQPVTSFLYALPTISLPAGGFERVRIMLRVKVLVSAVPLIVAAILARVEYFPSSQPCIAIGANTLQISSVPWHADLHVSFTDDPSLATVRVAISDNAEAADFAVVDDVDGIEDAACESKAGTQFVAISAHASASAAVIYLTHDYRASDYRIFVRSKRFTEHDAAALVVGAHGEPPHLAALL
jgi:hypothetical protein